MIKVDGVLYYSCNELANALNNPDPRRPLENDLKIEKIDSTFHSRILKTFELYKNKK